jgi:hypothetical protein
MCQALLAKTYGKESNTFNHQKTVFMRKFNLLQALFLFIAFTVKAQDQCPTSIDLTWLQANNPDLYQRYIDLENFTATYTNPNSISD